MSETLVDPSELRPDPNQPRRVFNEEEIKALAESYKAQGVIVPIEVDKNNVIILGERRWRAAEIAGVKVPIRRKANLTQKQRLERQLTDDAHRTELSLQEKVWAYATGVVNINEKTNYTIDQVKKMDKDALSATLWIKSGKRVGDEKSGVLTLSEHIGVPERTITTYLSYFKVGRELQTAFDDGRIQLVYLYEVSKLSDLPEEQVKLEKLVLENKFRRRDDIREYIDELRRKRGETIVKAVKEVVPVPTPEVKLETPEELEEAAKVLRKKAKEIKTPEQILEEKREQARKSLLTGEGSSLSKIEKAKKFGIDTVGFEERLEGIKTKIVDDPDGALKESTELKRDVGNAIKDFKEKKKEEKIRKKVEKETTKKLRKSKEFRAKILEEEQERLRKEAEEAEKRQIEEVVERLPQLTADEKGRLQEFLAEELKRIDERLRDPKIKARGELFMNWIAHSVAVQYLSGMFCPKCKKEKLGELRWSCCQQTVEDSYQQIVEKLSGGD